MAADLWTRKIAAYLAWPTDHALNPTGAEIRAASLLSAMLDTPMALPQEAKEAARTAAGLDAPPLPDTAPPVSFLDHPTIIHPISGATHNLNLARVDPDKVAAA